MRKVLAFALAVLMLLGCFSSLSVVATESEAFNFDTTRVGYAVANVEKVDTNGLANITTIEEASIPTSGTYLISNAAGLARLSALVNAGNAFSGVTFVQTADLDMKDVSWMPIGFNATTWNANPFKGTYDGQGHTVSNLTFSPSEVTANTAMGLLFACANGATIQNVVLDDTCTVSWYGAGNEFDIYMGSILGRDAGAPVTVSNCYSAATLKNTNIHGTSTAGGIGGTLSVSGGLVEYCTFAGSVQGVRRVGGILAFVHNVNATITNCCNTGTVFSTATSKATYNAAGGICGAPHNTGSSLTTITGCVNYGSVSSAGVDQFAGGIIGCARTYNSASGNIDYGTVHNASGEAPSTIYGGAYYVETTAESLDRIDETNKVLRGVGKAEAHGYQIRQNGTDAVDLRFVGSIDSTSYNAVGLRITVTFTATVNGVTKTIVKKLDPIADPVNYAACSTTTVYESLTAMYNGENTEYAAKALRDDQKDGYLFAVILENLPKAVGELTVTVVPFCKDEGDASIVREGMPKSMVINPNKYPGSNLVTSPSNRYEGFTSFTMNIGDPILIHHGEPYADLGWGPYQFPSLHFTKFGSILCNWGTNSDKIDGGVSFDIPSGAVSDDGGLTWRTKTGSDAASYESLSLMSNGNYFAGFVGKTAYVVEGLDEKHTPVMGPTYENKKLFLPADLVAGGDLDLTYQAKEYDPNTGIVTTFDCTVNWPNQLISVYYGGDYTNNTIHPPQRELALGNGLADLAIGDKLYYCVYARGLNPETGEVDEFSQYFSTFIFCSEDNARTWDLVTQIRVNQAIVDESTNHSGHFEGFGEAKMELMPDGSVVLLARTGSNQPCYMMRSTDGCKTWSDPVKFDEVGVRPFIVTLDCGVTLASYGRDGLFLRATCDPSGLVWEDHIEISLSENPQNPASTKSCYYTYILPLSETSALLVYSDFYYSPTGNAADAGKSILGRIITVDPHMELTVSNSPGVGASGEIDCSGWLDS